MKFFIMMFLSFNLYAKGFVENPNKIFNLEKASSTQISVTIDYTDNIQQTCEKLSREHGNNGFGYAVEACSFWDENKPVSNCSIIVPKKVSMITLAHEFIHCVFGDWH